MKNKLSVAAIILALILGGIGALKNHIVVENTTPAKSVGSATSPDISSPYFSVGDVIQWKGKTTALTQATTTICAIQSPAATSTLVTAGIRLSVSSTTASIIQMANSTTAFATTTQIGTDVAVAANAFTTIIASTTAANIFAPSTWFVVGMKGNSGTFSPTGICQATWEQY